jgi:hypothetical protein
LSSTTADFEHSWSDTTHEGAQLYVSPGDRARSCGSARWDSGSGCQRYR